jgi:hypothetical protein
MSNFVVSESVVLHLKISLSLFFIILWLPVGFNLHLKNNFLTCQHKAPKGVSKAFQTSPKGVVVRVRG